MSRFQRIVLTSSEVGGKERADAVEVFTRLLAHGGANDASPAASAEPPESSAVTSKDQVAAQAGPETATPSVLAAEAAATSTYTTEHDAASAELPGSVTAAILAAEPPATPTSAPAESAPAVATAPTAAVMPAAELMTPQAETESANAGKLAAEPQKSEDAPVQHKVARSHRVRKTVAVNQDGPFAQLNLITAPPAQQWPSAKPAKPRRWSAAANPGVVTGVGGPFVSALGR